MTKKILVTAATGKVASQLIGQLADKGESVKAAVRNLEKGKGLIRDHVELTYFDFEKPASFKEAFDGVDRLFLITPVENPQIDRIVIPLIDLAKGKGVRHIVYMTAMGVDQMDSAPMRIIEKHIEASGIPYTFLRPSWFMQNFSTMHVGSIKNQNAIFVAAGDGKTSFIDIRDIAAVAAAALTDEKHQNKAYALTGAESLDHHQVASVISKYSGKNIQYVPISEEDLVKGLQSFGTPPHLIEMMVMLFRFVRQGYTGGVSHDVNDVLGRPPISFDQFAKDHADCWK